MEMDVVVGAVQQQLSAVRARRVDLEQQLEKLSELRVELRGLRASERLLLTTLARLQGDQEMPRQRRRPADNEGVVRAWMREQKAARTLSEIHRGVALPLSSVRNAVRRMADVTQREGKLWELSK